MWRRQYEGVTHIDYRAFRNCNSLESVTLPEGIKTISSEVFNGCSSLQMVIIPESVSSVSTDSFPSSTILAVYENSYAHTFAVKNHLLYYLYDGVNLPEITKINGITYFVANGEAMAIGAEKTLSEAEVVSEVNGCPVTTLQETFKDCTLLTKVTLPDTLTVIGNYAFYYCNKLTAIEIGGCFGSIQGLMPSVVILISAAMVVFLKKRKLQ